MGSWALKWMEWDFKQKGISGVIIQQRKQTPNKQQIYLVRGACCMWVQHQLPYKTFARGSISSTPCRRKPQPETWMTMDSLGCWMPHLALGGPLPFSWRRTKSQKEDLVYLDKREKNLEASKPGCSGLCKMCKRMFSLSASVQR